VFRWVNGKKPMQYGFDFGLWTRHIVRELIRQRFGVRLSLASIGAVLARQGLTSQKPLHLILDGLPAHKTLAVKEYVAGLDGRLTVHYLPGYAPDLNPDELVWSHAKRTGNARRPLQKGEHLVDRITAQLAEMARRPALVRSFFSHPSVAYIAAC